ncbi:MAG: hypothetical protein HY000_30510 [Planctomycetes bacterium]|nr:hypothetical protein [Planctomycetota bacterium]
MIRIVKPGHAPAILRDRGRDATQAIIAAYVGGTRIFAFDSAIYGAKSVKKALRKAQHDKCAFCESRVTHVAYGDVEHFRPKGGYRQSPEDDLVQPGYYWLAYEWSNLFFACQLCNQRFKRNHFPLLDTAKRATSHVMDVSVESPVFLDPSAEDPAEHIAFREEYAYALDGSARGEATIAALGLNREELVEVRRDRLAWLKNAFEHRAILAEAIIQLEATALPRPMDVDRWLMDARRQVEKSSQLLAAQILPTAEYSAMAHAALA